MAAQIQSPELSKAFGKDQTPYSTYDTVKASKKDKREDVKKEFEKQMDGFIKMYIASIQNQDPFSESSQADSGIQIAGQMAQMQIFGGMNDQLAELVDNFAMSQILKATEFQGQEVSFDDNVRDYNGKDPVTFDYELNYPQSVKSSSSVKCNVKIYNANTGSLVYSGRSDGTSDGKNTFSWNGTDIKGKKAAEGEYRIEVTASAVVSDSNTIPVPASTYKKGVVTSVHMTKDGKLELELADGTKIDQDKVKKITNPNVIRPDSKVASNELAHYIGRQVAVDLSILEIKGNRGEITYNNSDPLKNPGKVIVEIFDKNHRFVKKIEYEKLERGSGTLQVDPASLIPDGKYSCKIFVEDKDNEEDGKYTRIELSKNDILDVSSVDVAKQSIIGNDKDGIRKEYNVRYIAGLDGNSSLTQSLINQGNTYIGKNVVYEIDNNFVWEGDSFSEQASIPKAPDGRNLTKATLEIYDGDKLVGRVEKDGLSLYSNEVEPVPFYNAAGIDAPLLARKGYLDNTSRRAVRRYITDLRLPGVSEYANLERTEKLAVNKYIEQEFRAGNFFKHGQDRADPAIKLKNMGLVKFEWDGRMLDGALAATDKQYSYKINIETTDNANPLQKYTDPIPNGRIQSSVKATEIEDGVLKLILASGEELLANQVLAVGA